VIDSKELLAPAIERLAEQYRLSHREAEVTLSCAEGLTNAAIAERLKVSTETIKFHLKNIFDKVGVARRGQLIAMIFLRDLEKKPKRVVPL
jgi:DNA-binding CsgD family transcriptional regulator